MKKPAALSADLIARKGSAAPVIDMPTRSPEPAPMARAENDDEKDSGLSPLNFRVPASFRREFKTYAAAHDLKLNELLRRSFEAYRRAAGD